MRHCAGSGRVVNPLSALLAAWFACAYLAASFKDFSLQLPVTTTSTGPPWARFIGTMAFSAKPPPCMNKTLKFEGMAKSSRRSDSAWSQMPMNSLPRWLISMTPMPLPFQLLISSAACSKTSSGITAGPAEKFQGRVMPRWSRRRCPRWRCLRRHGRWRRSRRCVASPRAWPRRPG